MPRRFLETLSSQQNLIALKTKEGLFIVYGYLRSKGSKTAVAGMPYYIGIATNKARPYAPHTRGSSSKPFHEVPVPTDKRLIRFFGGFPTREEACLREIYLIARYGRKHIDENGILLNRSLGGELGAYGAKRSAWTRGRISAAKKELTYPALAAEAAVMGLDPEWFYALTHNQKKGVRKRFRDGVRGRDLLVLELDACKSHGYRQRKAVQATEYGISIEEYAGMSPNERNAMKQWCRRNPGQTGSDYLARLPWLKYELSEAEWKSFTQKQRNAIVERYRRGLRGAQLLEATHVRQRYSGMKVSEKAAERYGVDLEVWLKLEDRVKEVIGSRFRSGKRGELLLKDLI
jgi:predicted GIY-YIG superfamily endonuclease